MVNAKTFEFVARMAMLTGYKSINLTSTTNFVKFQPELIDSYMPFYGSAYSGVGYGTDDGLKFSVKPEEFTVTKGKKNYQVDATVKGEKNTFNHSLSVGFEGSASHTISRNNTSVIPYSGNIYTLGKKD